MNPLHRSSRRPSGALRSGRSLVVLASAVAAIALVAACGNDAPAAADRGDGAPTAQPTTVAPPPDARWQYQLQARKRQHRGSGGIDVGVCAVPFAPSIEDPACVRPAVIDFDLYLDKPGPAIDRIPNRGAVRALHRRDGYAICYVDAGGIENYRPDYPRFVRWHRRHGNSLLGKPFSKRFPEERWANVGGERQRRFLVRMMAGRVAKCRRAGFDAVEFDVVEASAAPRRVTGWKVSDADQLKYNRALARVAHRNGLAVGLKNDLGQVVDLVDDFDFAINEECIGLDECKLLAPFVAAGKPVYHVEYEIPRAEFCAKTDALGFNSIKKGSDFSLYARPYGPCS